MKRDRERVRRNAQALSENGIDAVVCMLPTNVLLLTGYWPVIGTSVAITTRDERVILVVPEDELSLAECGWADDLVGYRAATLDTLPKITDMLTNELRKVVGDLNGKPIGYERDVASVPVSYAAMTMFGCSVHDIVAAACPRSSLRGAGDMLVRLASTLTTSEIERVRLACRIAGDAYAIGVGEIRIGSTEIEVAAAFRRPLGTSEECDVSRSDGFTFCMSGENAYEAYAAFQRSTQRKLRSSDLVLVHCNSFADGFWTDITRTYCIGEPDERRRSMFEAVLDALNASFASIRPGVKASAVDAAAREILQERGYGNEFVHGLGHGVGYAAIDHNARPRLHPASSDRLETGMVFNIEPAIYIEGFGGIRHCDMVAVTDTGAALLTAFQRDISPCV